MPAMILSYPASIRQVAADDFELRFRDVPEAITGGSSPEAALANAPDALEAAVEGYIAVGRDIPTPSIGEEGEQQVALGAAVALRSLLLNAMRAQRLSKSALAERMRRDEKVVRRILSGKNASIEQTLDALRAVDVHPVVGAELPAAA